VRTSNGLFSSETIATDRRNPHAPGKGSADQLGRSNQGTIDAIKSIERVCENIKWAVQFRDNSNGSAQSACIVKGSADQFGRRAIREQSGVGWGVRDGGGIRTCWDVVEGDAGAGEGVLDVVGDAVGVPVGGDGDGAGVAGGGEGGAHVLRDEVGVAVAGDLAVLDVPPHRGLHRRVLPHSPRRRQPRFRRRSGRVGVFLWFATAAASREVGLQGFKEGICFSWFKKRYKFGRQVAY